MNFQRRLSLMFLISFSKLEGITLTGHIGIDEIIAKVLSSNRLTANDKHNLQALSSQLNLSSQESLKLELQKLLRGPLSKELTSAVAQ